MDPRSFPVSSRFAPAVIAFTRFNGWLLIVLGTLTLGYVVFGEFTSRLLRGGVFELALGIFALVSASSWRRKLASSSR